MTPDIVLHHYAGSPFSEKLRLILGHKRLAWRSVDVPVILPKPDVVALTGGYRRTPLLQVGADIYADTAVAARWIDSHAPDPSIFPVQVPLAPIVAAWADTTLFWTVIPVAMQPAGLARLFAGAPPERLQAFAADRKPFTAGMTRLTTADAAAALAGYLAAFDRQLAMHGGPWLFGGAASIADFSVAHTLWYLRRSGPPSAAVDAHPALSAWLDRVLAIGHGSSTPMTGADALALAAAAGRHAPCEVGAGQRWTAGQAVTVTAIDYGRDPVAGTLVGLDDDEVVVRRSDPRAGTVHVHLPRVGYQIRLKEETT